MPLPCALVPAIPDLDLARIRRFCEGRVSPRHRDEVRVEADVRGGSVTIRECRPPWDGSDAAWTRQPMAQLRYRADTCDWALYWADRNGRWHRYEQLAPGAVDVLLSEIESDPTCIFWG